MYGEAQGKHYILMDFPDHGEQIEPRVSYDQLFKHLQFIFRIVAV